MEASDRRPTGTAEIQEGSRHDLTPNAPEAESYSNTAGAMGSVHTYEIGSRLDGPGVRLTLFLSGCPLRCKYCHNPDTWHLKHGVRVSADQVISRLGHFAPALRAMRGGLAISGGEVLVQAAFSRRILTAAKSMGLHTAIETSGFLGARADDDYLNQLDLVILDIVAIRHQQTNRVADPQSPIAAGDAVLLLGQPDALERARGAIGHVETGRTTKDRSNLDLVRIYVSRSAVVGTKIDAVRFPDDAPAKIAEVRRGDALLFPAPDLVLKFGDRLGVVASRESFPALRRHFGDSIKSTAEFSYVSVGLGMSLGVLLGLLRIPIPGLGSFSLGLAGGPLVIALAIVLTAILSVLLLGQRPGKVATEDLFGIAS